MKSPISGKHIVLGITGGISAYKSVFLLRLLRKAGAEVKVVMTENAKELVRPSTFASLSGNPVISDFFVANSGEWHSHVDLGLWADLMLICPATANTIAKMAAGIADNMLLTTYLSAKEKVMIAPAMDLDMWSHPATQRNITQLIKDGVSIIEPSAGELASGLIGKGRMAEPEEILKAVEKTFSNGVMDGIKVMVTAGPTYENIDPVRFIGNYSSGKTGFAIAESFANKGAEVFLVTGPVTLETNHSRIRRIDVRSAVEMNEVCHKIFPDVNIGIFTAAVADYRPQSASTEKIKREKNEEMVINLVRNPDIAAEMGKIKKDNQITMGFSLETDADEEQVLHKMEKKNFDWIALNVITKENPCFNSDKNELLIISAKGEKIKLEQKDKRQLADDIVEILADNNNITIKNI